MKKIIISVTSLMIILLLSLNCYAATASINLSASSDKVTQGKTFTMTLAATADNNISGMDATLSYDTSKLSIESKNAGTGFIDLSGSNSISIGSNSNSLSKSATLYTITFKVLDTAVTGTTTIEVKNAKLALINDNSEQVNVDASSDASTTVTIQADSTLVQMDEPTEEPAVIVDKDDVDDEPKETPKTTTTTSKLPQTGISEVSLIAIVVFAVIGTTSFVLYKKNNY